MVLTPSITLIASLEPRPSSPRFYIHHGCEIKSGQGRPEFEATSYPGHVEGEKNKLGVWPGYEATLINFL